MPCQAGVCDYRLDVRGGWYDAGDHGKYVVNGGIATAQLLSTFERTKTAATAGVGAALGDSTLRVPERGNEVPDILDEARWELEFLLRMQVPAGKPLAGMAHHKMHDQNWTGLPLRAAGRPAAARAAPAVDRGHAQPGRRRRAGRPAVRPVRRGVRRPAALTAAKTAYAAAKAHPAVYAEPDRRQRRRRVQRQRRHRRVLLGGGRAVPDHRRGDLPGPT